MSQYKITWTQNPSTETTVEVDLDEVRAQNDLDSDATPTAGQVMDWIEMFAPGWPQVVSGATNVKVLDVRPVES